MTTKYEKDFFAWCDEQAGYIAGHRFDDIDTVNLEDELRDLRRRVKEELIDYLTIIFTHLLMWKFMKPSFIFPYRCDSWKRTVEDHREKVRDLLLECPSLSLVLQDAIKQAYRRSRYAAYQRTTFSYEIFPETNPFIFEKAMEDGWLPD